ncbi:MAG: hypothetical protein Q9219_006548 [cf. Caloplaca sp. 3 TL-2023]
MDGIITSLAKGFAYVIMTPSHVKRMRPRDDVINEAQSLDLAPTSPQIQEIFGISRLLPTPSLMQNSQSQNQYFNILQWRQDVTDTIRSRKPPQRIAGSSNCKGSQYLRQPLTEISYNPRLIKDTASRKRKMDDEEWQFGPSTTNVPKRGRGRPPKLPLSASEKLVKIPIRDHHPSTDASQSETSSRKLMSRSHSRSGKGKQIAKTFDDPKSLHTITISYLAQCNPSVIQMSVRDFRVEHGQLPEETASLLSKMQSIPKGVIPSDLKSSYEEDAATPRKSKDPPDTSDYLPSHLNPYPPGRLESLKIQVDQTLTDADWNYRMKVHEKQWGALYNELISELRRIKYGQPFRSLNVETCSVDLEPLRTRLPDGTMLIYDEKFTKTGKKAKTAESIESAISSETGESAETAETAETAATAEPDTFAKIVDWALALDLSFRDIQTIDKAFAKIKPNEGSLNQSLSPINKSPLFAHIEIKITPPVSDPEVQIAVWASAEFKKKQHHGWDLSLPIPAITISGHEWSYYLFVLLDHGLVMLGPFDMGDTSSPTGIWAILYRLNVLIKWGTTTYRHWFDNTVMKWARDVAGESGGGCRA